MPLRFEPNLGQDASNARFVAHAPGYLLRLNPRTATLTLSEGKSVSRPEADRVEISAKESERSVSMELRGAKRNPGIVPEEKLQSTSSYFTRDEKSSKTGVPNYGRVHYSDIYPSIDLDFYGRGNRLEYDFLVGPHANTGKVQLKFKGAEELRVDSEGNLALHVGTRDMRFLKPVAYQEEIAGGARRPVDVQYKVEHGRDGALVSFVVGTYDHDKTLVIDPVLDYATYLSSAYSDVTSVSADAAGNSYLLFAGGGYWNTSFTVVKFDPNGNLLTTATVTSTGPYYYGVNPAGIAVSSSGAVFVVGSAAAGLPTTPNGYQAANQNSSNQLNAFLAVFQPSGSALSLSYLSYLGGSNSDDYGMGIAVDSSGNAYIAGQANSTDFPTTSGVYQPNYLANTQAGFVAKLNPSLSGASSLVYSTFLGGAGTPGVSSIAVDGSGNAYLGSAATSGFPVTSGALSYAGVDTNASYGIYVTKLNPAAIALVYSAYLGPVQPDNYNNYGISVAVDGSGDAYVTGIAAAQDFPTTSGAYQTSYPGAFVSELNPAGTGLIYSTFLGGPSNATNYSEVTPDSLAISSGCVSACNVYVAGHTTAPDFPTINAIQSYQGASPTVFAVELTGSGSSAVYSTYLGGITSSEQQPYFAYVGYTPSPQSALDGAGNLYIAGNLSSDTDYPVTPSSIEPSLGTAYLAKLGSANAANIVATPSSITFPAVPVGVSSATYSPTSPTTIVLRNMGSQAVTLQPFWLNPANEFAETDNCNGAIAGGGWCTVTVTYTATAATTQTGMLTIQSASTTLATIPLSGSGQDTGFVVASPSSLSFADQVAASTSAAQTVTFTNVGNTPVGIGSYSFNAIGFTQQNNCPPTLQPSQSCQFAFQFAPNQPGSFTSSFAISPTGSAVNPTVTLTGQGVASGAGGSGSLTLSANALNFNSQLIGTTGYSQTVYITNSGTVPVTVNSITSTLANGSVGNANDFQSTSVYSNCYSPYIGYSNVLSPQQSCYINVSFTPSAAGTETATLSINDTTLASPETVTLTGIGVAASQVLEFLPGNQVFADQPVGVPSAAQTFYVYSTGTAPVTIDRALVSGDFQLSYDWCSSRTITGVTIPGTAGGYCYVSVTFTPTVVGARTGTLTLIDSATGTPQVLSLAGNGIAQSGTVMLDPSALVFPAQPQGTTSSSQTVSLSNPGNTPVTVNSITTTGNFAETWNYGSLPFTLSPGGNYSVYVTFTPTVVSATPVTGSLVIGSSAGNQTATLSGTGEAATQSIGFTPSTVNFGSIANGTTSYTYTIYVRNTGTVPVTFTSAPTITGNFAVTSDQCTGGGSGQLAATSSCYINLAFTPSGSGAQSGTLTLTDSAGTGTQNLTLSGTGVAAAPSAVAVPYGMAFSQQLKGTGSSWQWITMQDNSLTSAKVTSVRVSSGSANFVIPYDECTGQTLTPSTTCGIYVEFAPTVAGNDTGVVTFATTSGSYTAAVAGYGLAASDSSYLSPSSLTFSSQVLSTTSSNQLIYFNNTSNGTVTMGTVAGTNYGPTSEFSLWNSYDYCSGATVAPGSSCYVYVEFTPSAVGARSGTLAFPFDYWDGAIGTQTATLKGTGVTQYNEAVLAPTILTFTDQVVGTTISYQPIYLTNNGNVAFTVASVTGTNYGATSEFWVYNAYSGYDSCSGNSVAPGSSCYIYVAFTPSAAGARSGTLNFPVTYYNATSAVNLTATLSGNGIAASNLPALLTPNVNFGNQGVGTTSGYQYIYLNNSGNQAFTVGSVSGTNYGLTSEFWLYSAYSGYDSCSGTTVAPGSSCYILAAFTPSAAGARSGTLVFPVTYPGATSAVNYTTTLSGTGIAANSGLVFSQSTVAFGNQPVSTSSAQVQLLLINPSSAAIAVSSIALGGTNLADFSETDNCAGYTINANSSCTITLGFTPSLLGAESATITETDGNGGTPSVNLTGTGTNGAAAAVFYPTTLTFSSQVVGEGSGPQFFTVTNGGINNLTITGVASSDAVEFPVAQDGCTGQSLTQGMSCTVGVLFAPGSTGSHSATINISDNASGSPQKMTVSGVGATELTSSVSLTASPASAALGSLFTFTATVAGQNSKPVSNGSVTFFDGTTVLGTVQVVRTTSGGAAVGTATLHTLLVPLGSNSITAKYVGGDVTSTSAAKTVTITGKYPSTLTFASSPSAGDYTFTGTLLGTGPMAPTGSVSFTDGTTDAVIGTVSITPATATQNFVLAPTVSALSTPLVVALADVNGDGIPDLVTGTNGNGITVQLGNGDGTFQAPSSNGFPGGSVTSIAFGDFSGDGKLDIVAAVNGSVGVILGNGDGTFQEETYYDNAYVAAVVAGDFNGDGILDIAAVNGSNVDVLMGKGDGTFQGPLSVAVGNPATSLAAGDFNGDGKLDIAATNGNAVSVLLGDGNGTFQAPVAYATGNEAAFVAASDLTGNGKLDLVVANSADNTVSVLLGNGNGTFQSQQAYATGDQSGQGISIAVGDVYGNGKPDILVNNYNDFTVSLLPGNGDGTFSAQSLIQVGGNPYWVLLSDVNHDGRPDVVVANGGSGMANILLNQVTQTATLNNAFVLGTGMHSVSAAYAGDTNFAASTSNALQLKASLVTPTMQLVGVPAASVIWGQSISVSANLSGALSTIPVPTGSVSYAVDGGTAQTVALANGAITIPLGQLSVGSHNISISYGGDQFYTTLAAQSLALTVTKAPLTVTVNSASKAYGAANPAFSGTVTGLVNGDTVTVTYSSTATASSAAGSYPITATVSGAAAGNYTPTIISGALTVGKAVLTVTANNASKVYGASNPGFSDTITGFVDGDTSAVVTGTASLTTTATPASGVGSYPITAAAGTLAASNYTFTFANGALTVTSASLTVTASNASKIYGAANPALTYAIAGFVSGDTVAVVSGTVSLTTTATAASAVGSYPITASAGTLAASNYSFTFAPGTLTVGAAPLTVVVTSASKTYGASNPAFGGTITGLLNGDTVTAAYSSTATASSAVGSYAITATLSGAALGNYTPTVTSGTLTVGSAPLTVTVNSASKTYGASNPAFGGTVTGLLNGDTVTAAYSSTATASSAVGSYAITATLSGAASSNYTPTVTPGTLTVGKAALTVTASNASRSYGASNPAFSDTITGFVNGDTVAVVTGTASLTTTATAASAVGSYPVTASAGTLAASNYSFTFATGTLTVGSAPLTVAVNSASKTYGASNPAFGGTITGLLNGDMVTAAYSSTATTSSAVGSYAITATLSGAALSNYTPTVTPGTLTVGSAPLTVVVTSASKTYGASNPAFGGTITGLLNGDTVTAAYNSTATASSAVGSYAITATLSGAALSNYTPTVTPGTLTVGSAPLTVVVTSASKTYGASNPAFGGTITGLLNGDTVTAAYSSTATASSAVGSYAITATLSGAALGNYTPTVTSGTLTVGSAPLTVTVNSASKTYGASNPAFGGTVTGLLNGDTVTAAYSSTATASSAVGSYAITATLSGAALSNYTPTVTSGTLTVGKAALTVTASNASRLYGAANPAFGDTITGFVNGDTVAVVTGTASLTTTATTASAVGSYPVTASAGTLAASNYSFTFATGTLTVGSAPLTVAVNSASRTYGASNPAFSGTVTGLLNGDTVTAAYSSTATASSAVGGYAITATLSGTALSNYTPTITPGTLTVGSAPLTVAVNSASRTYGASNPAFSATVTGLLNGDTVTAAYSSTATASSAVGSYAITATLSGAALSNYTPTVTSGTLTVGSAPLTVVVTSASKTYGASNPAFGGTITGLLNGDTVTAAYSSTATVSSAVGSYAITATLSGAALGNYTPTVTSGTLTVGAAPLTVAVNSASKTYGASNPAFGGTVTGLLNGDTLTAAYSSTATASSAVGSYAITATLSGAALSNYTPTITPGTLSVSKAGLTVTASNASRPYGASNPAFSDTITGFVNGDTVAVVTGTASLTTTATAASAVGSYPVTASAGTLAASNYSFTFATGTLTVGAAPLTVAVNSASKTYGASNPAFGGTVTGLLNGDMVTAAYSSTATTSSAVGSYAITATLSGTALSNYTPTITPGTLTVTKAVLKVTANNASKVYGAANPGITDTISGFVNGDTSTVVTGTASLTTTATAKSGVGSYTITAAAGTLAASDYSFTFTPGTLTVTKAVLKVTANNASKVYGAANPAFNETTSGFVNGDTSTVVTGTASLTTTATAKSGVGSYTITAAAGTLAASDYSFTFTPGTLTVTKAVLKVTANNASKVYGAANPGITDTVSSFVNGDTSTVVTGTASLTTTATAKSGVGSYTITAAAGTLAASNYSFTFTPGTLTVTKAVLKVTANNASKVYGAANPGITDTVSSFVNGDTSTVVTGTASLTTTATAKSGVGSYTITAAAGTLAASNYSFTFTPGTLTVTKAVLKVTANNASKVYGAVNPAFNETTSGFVNGDTSTVVTGTASLTTTATTTSLVGTYPITFSTESMTASNYSFTYVNGMLTVTAAIPTITSLSPSSATAKGTAFTLTINGTGFISGAVARWGTTALTTTYVSATKLTAAVPASLITTAGKASVTVTTAGGTSTAATFTIE